MHYHMLATLLANLVVTDVVLIAQQFFSIFGTPCQELISCGVDLALFRTFIINTGTTVRFYLYASC